MCALKDQFRSNKSSASMSGHICEVLMPTEEIKVYALKVQTYSYN